MPRKPPEIRPIVDVEDDLATVLLCVTYGEILRGRVIGPGEMRSGNDDRLGGGDIGFVDVAFVESAVSAIFAIKDQRECLVVADAEHHD